LVEDWNERFEVKLFTKKRGFGCHGKRAHLKSLWNSG
jgi:hypothetical protein